MKLLSVTISLPKEVPYTNKTTGCAEWKNQIQP